MERAEALNRLAAARVGRFASLGPGGRPHIVPVTFAVVDELVLHMIDDKPKTTSRLQRLRNVEADARASLLVDHYDEDWSRLWWVRVDGEASVETGGERWEKARSALAGKYTHYRDAPPEGPAICLTMDMVTSWASEG
jgi:PPOX class probable F420-dependent enzyme